MNSKVSFLGKMKHQKTALSDGFNVTVDSRLSIVPHTVLILYHKIDKLSIIRKRLRGADGIRTRIACVRDRQSAINLPPQFTEAKTLSQIRLGKVNSI